MDQKIEAAFNLQVLTKSKLITMYQQPKKRSVLINGHRTSVSLEDNFWFQFCNIARKNNISINKLLTKVDLDRAQKCSLAGAIRLYVLKKVIN